MAKVKYIKLSDAVEMLEVIQNVKEIHFQKIIGAPDIYADAYRNVTNMLKRLPTVEMEDKED